MEEDSSVLVWVSVSRIYITSFWLDNIVQYLQVFGDEEWSFGYCEEGSGVFSCPSGRNPMYTYRECVVLGKTNLSISKVNQLLRELSREWPGESYDLLSKNCNHFCDELCERVGVPKLPGNISSCISPSYKSFSYISLLPSLSLSFNHTHYV